MTSMIEWARKYYHRQMYAPGLLAAFLNPFYISRRELRLAVERHARFIKGRVLDVGCGSKPYSDLVVAEDYVGLEIDSKSSRERGIADAYYDGRTFPFEDGSFDCVICSQVLEHVFEPDQFLSEIRRVLRVNGYLLITVPFVWDEHEQPFDYARYSSFGLRDLLTKRGFVIERLEKLAGDVSVLFQLFNAYIFKSSQVFPRIVQLAITVLIMGPLNLLGLLLRHVTPSNPDLYLDLVVLATRGKSSDHDVKKQTRPMDVHP